MFEFVRQHFGITQQPLKNLWKKSDDEKSMDFLCLLLIFRERKNMFLSISYRFLENAILSRSSIQRGAKRVEVYSIVLWPWGQVSGISWRFVLPVVRSVLVNCVWICPTALWYHFWIQRALKSLWKSETKILRHGSGFEVWDFKNDAKSLSDKPLEFFPRHFTVQTIFMEFITDAATLGRFVRHTFRRHRPQEKCIYFLLIETSYFLMYF